MAGGQKLVGWEGVDWRDDGMERGWGVAGPVGLDWSDFTAILNHDSAEPLPTLVCSRSFCGNYINGFQIVHCATVSPLSSSSHSIYQSSHTPSTLPLSLPLAPSARLVCSARPRYPFPAAIPHIGSEPFVDSIGNIWPAVIP